VNGTPGAIIAASILVLVACGSNTTSYRDFKAHTQSAQAAAVQAGFGPGWTAQEARKYAATEVEWLNAHSPEGCYALLHADLTSVFQARANGEFNAPPPPSLMQHLQAAETAC
jgi:hypothetical protein